jgi:hypothetical protein
MIVWDLQLVSWVVSFIVFLMMWYVDSSFFPLFLEFSWEIATLFGCLVCECWDRWCSACVFY